MSEEVTSTESVESGNTRRRLLTGMGAAAAAGGGLLALTGTPSAQAAVNNASYYTYGPTRYVDTRTNSGGRIYGGDVRTLTVLSGAEYTMAANLTVVSTSGTGYLAIYSADLSARPQPYSSINWQGNGRIVANFSLFDLGDAGFTVYCGGSSASTHFIIDAVGFFLNNGAAGVPPKVKAWEKEMERRLARQNQQ